MNISPKKIIINKIEQEIRNNNSLRILDLGSGQSRNFIDLLKEYPHVTYVGIEPSEKDSAIARELLKDLPNAKIINQLAYDRPEGMEEFDICVSLSVLEHIKQLDVFLANSIMWVKPGGKIIHFYDLGHALYPHNFKAWIHKVLGNNLPGILPEKQFVRYVDVNDVIKILESGGASITDITYHQMLCHRDFAKQFTADTEEKQRLVRDMFEWEFKISKFLKDLPQPKREKLFPSICVWAEKK